MYAYANIRALNELSVVTASGHINGRFKRNKGYFKGYFCRRLLSLGPEKYAKRPVLRFTPEFVNENRIYSPRNDPVLYSSSRANNR